jgi:hypothetical protein
LRFYGTKAILEVTNNRVTLLSGDGVRKDFPFSGPYGFHAEFIDFHRAITQKRKPLMDAKASYRDFISTYTGLMAAQKGKTLAVPAIR